MIAVHGLGYVGLTAAVYWAQAGEDVVGFDPDLAVVQAVQAGTPRAGDFLAYLGHPVRELVHAGRLRATSRWDDIVGAEVHIVAVPTERADGPDMRIVQGVLSRLAPWMGGGRQIWVESTLIPGTLDEWLAELPKRRESGFSGVEAFESLLSGRWDLAVCPRRDWFADPERNLATLPRVVGAVTPEGTLRVIQRLQRVSPHCLSTTYRTAELVKVLENALLHVPVMFAHELALKLPDLDVAEALRLAGTHWRLPTYHVGFGTGGRCIPLASQYLQQAIGVDDHGLLDEAIWQEEYTREAIVDWALGQAKGAPILVAGIAYRPGFRDAGHSPGLAIAKGLLAAGGAVRVNDPRWAERELLTLTGIEPGQMDQSVGVLLLATAHAEYAEWPEQVGRWRPGQVVLDAHGSWARYEARFHELGVRYTQVGKPGWRG